MKKLLLASALGLASTSAFASTALAGLLMPTLTLGYAVGGGSIVTLDSYQRSVFYNTSNDPSTTGNLSGNTLYGQFVNFDLGVNGGSSISSPVTVYLTESGLTGQQIQSVSAQLTSNQNDTPLAAALSYTVYGSSTDQIFGGTVLGSSTVSGTASVVNLYDGAFNTGTGLYSLTQAITITPNATAGYTNVSLDGSVSVPEPGSLALLGTGLMALGLLVRKRQKRG